MDDDRMLQPFYWPAAFEEPIVLYDGPAEIEDDGSLVEAVIRVTFEWRPSPTIRVRGATRDVALSPFEVKERPIVLPPDAVPAAPLHGTDDDDRWTAAGHTVVFNQNLPHSTTIGDASDILTVLYHLINFGPTLLPDVITTVKGMGLCLRLDVGPWRLTLVAPAEAQRMRQQLHTCQSHGFTHLLWVARHDSGVIDVDELEGLHDALYHVLGFAEGGLVSLALPVGFDSADAPCWAQWRTNTVDPFHPGRLSWCDDSLLPDLGPLLTRWLDIAASADLYWRDILRRAIRYVVEANQTTPTDVRVAANQVALELLAWAVLDLEAKWLDAKDGELAFPGRLRLLLHWAGVPTSVDPALSALSAVAKERSLDGPAAVAWVRNRVVHPPKRLAGGSAEWPSREQQVDAWRLGLEWTELVILRILGHGGLYANRRHVGGRWPGQVEPVPWAAPAATSVRSESAESPPESGNGPQTTQDDGN